jgi:ABC-type glycerol-3-phosphate transport system permease component
MAAAQPRTVRGRIAIYMLAIAFALLAGFPFLWAALTMFRQDADLYDPTMSPTC